MIRDEAQAAAADGATSEALDTLTSCGKYGAYPANIQRDMQRRVLRLLQSPVRPYEVMVPKYCMSSESCPQPVPI